MGILPEQSPDFCLQICCSVVSYPLPPDVLPLQAQHMEAHTWPDTRLACTVTFQCWNISAQHILHLVMHIAAYHAAHNASHDV